MPQLSQSELLLAGLLAAVLVLLTWLLVRSYTSGRALTTRLTAQLGDELSGLMEQQLAAQHRELLRDLHDGLGRQTDRIGEHARADRELLQRGLRRGPERGLANPTGRWVGGGKVRRGRS